MNIFQAESMEVSPADDQDHILACMDESSKVPFFSKIPSSSLKKTQIKIKT